MGQKRQIQDENKRLKEERNLYMRVLEEANSRFERKVKELSLLKRIGDVISYTFDLELFCRELTEIIIEETNAENCSLMIKKPDSNKLILKVAKGNKDESTTYFEELQDSNIIFSVGEGVAGKVALEGKSILINDVKNDKHFDRRGKSPFPIGSILCCPFISQGQVLAVINLSNSQPNAFSDDDLRVMSIFSAFATSIFVNAISYIKVKESEEKFRAIFEGARDALLIVDPLSRKIIDCNKQTENWLGYIRKELLQMDEILDLLPSDSKKEATQRFEEIVRKTGEESTNEITFLGKDGNTKLGEIKASDIRYQEKKLLQLAIRDIAERKKAEELLKRSEEKYHNLIENANDAIVSTEENGIIIGFNTKAVEMFGYSREEILGKSFLLLVAFHERKRQGKIFQEITTTEFIGIPFEMMGLRKDGKEIRLENSPFVFKVQGGYILTTFMRDITERKEMTLKLLQSEKLKSLGELAGGVAHDFNNVLAAILGRVQLLRMSLERQSVKQERKKLMHEIKKGLEIIEKASEDGTETVRRIQEFSRRRFDDKNFTEVDINELIDYALEFTRVRWKDDTESRGKKIKIKKEFSPLPPIKGSASELREVFTNFINNALDAMPQGGQIKIKTFKKGNHIYVKLKDTGVGIPEVIKDRIFDPFFTTKGPQSTGLGMSVSYGIINRHRGTIKVDTVEGQGTTFIIKLPIISEKTTEKKEKRLQRKQRKARILVIEDEEAVRELLKDILTDGGHKVETASYGSKGVEMFKKSSFDMVFTDLGMPEMSGWQVAEETKKINRNIPVALITGWKVELEDCELRKKGVDLVVNKPFKVDRVLRLVQEGMELKYNFETKEMIRL